MFYHLSGSSYYMKHISSSIDRYFLIMHINSVVGIYTSLKHQPLEWNELSK